MFQSVRSSPLSVLLKVLGIFIFLAHAKMHLRSEVEKQDVETGIAVLLESFIQTQKHSSATKLKKEFSKYLAPVLK